MDNLQILAPWPGDAAYARVVAMALRDLADKLERAGAPAPRDVEPLRVRVIRDRR